MVTGKINIFALYNVNKHSMLRQKREKNGTGICHVMQGKESKTCPYDFLLTKQKIKKGKEISSKQIKEVKLPMFMMKIIIKKMKIIFIIESEIKK